MLIPANRGTFGSPKKGTKPQNQHIWNCRDPFGTQASSQRLADFQLPIPFQIPGIFRGYKLANHCCSWGCNDNILSGRATRNDSKDQLTYPNWPYPHLFFKGGFVGHPVEPMVKPPNFGICPFGVCKLARQILEQIRHLSPKLERKALAWEPNCWLARKVTKRASRMGSFTGLMLGNSLLMYLTHQNYPTRLWGGLKGQVHKEVVFVVGLPPSGAVTKS